MLSSNTPHNISQRQTRIVVITVLLLGVLFSCIQIFMEYDRFQGEVHSKTQQIVNSVLQAAVNAAYNYDENLAQQIADGVMEFKPIYLFKIIDESGNNMVEVKRELNLTPFEQALTWLPMDDIEEQIQLYHETMETEAVGALEVKVSVSQDRVLFADRAVSILLFGLFRSVILAIILLFVFKRLLTKPFLKMREDLLAVNLENPKQGRLPKPEEYPNNEFRDVVEVAKKLIHTIGDNLEQISEANDSLEEKVANRTKDLRQSEGRLRRAQKTAHLGSWEWRYGSHTSWWSDEVYKIVDIKARIGEDQTKELFAKMTDESKNKMRDAVRSLEQTGEPCYFEIELNLKDDSVRTCAILAEIEYSEKGTFEKLSGTLQDITQLKEAENESREMSARSRLLYEVTRKANNTSNPELAINHSLPILAEYLSCSVIRASILPEFQNQFKFSQALWLGYAADRKLFDALAGTEAVAKLVERVCNKRIPVWESIDKMRLPSESHDEHLRSILAIPILAENKVVAIMMCAMNVTRFETSREVLKVFQELGEQLGKPFERYMDLQTQAEV